MSKNNPPLSHRHTIIPQSLKEGSKIGVFSPSSWVDSENIKHSDEYMKSLGYETFIHPQTHEREHQSAGSVLQKTLAFQGLWQREDIDALWVAGGGNRCLHLLDGLKFEPLKRDKQPPKPVIGFSDSTTLLNAIYAHTGIITFHGPVYRNLHRHNKTQIEHLLALLAGKEDMSYPFASENILREGQATGHLVGGNLSLFQYLPHTLPDDFYDGAILFLEDCNEELSRVDRMMMQLRRLGVLDKCKALVLGEFVKMKDTGRPYGYTLDDIIREHTEGLDIPILHNMPFGHGDNLYTFPIGATATINTDQMLFKIEGQATTS
ncbi:MAG: LD-carboxypeptidase [Alphaproteobacteria bacterium]|nr:LD-carboxypeptidase [Alphaproteobacteria bacterium]